MRLKKKFQQSYERRIKELMNCFRIGTVNVEERYYFEILYFVPLFLFLTFLYILGFTQVKQEQSQLLVEN
jgi:hypothetical protein